MFNKDKPQITPPLSIRADYTFVAIESFYQGLDFQASCDLEDSDVPPPTGPITMQIVLTEKGTSDPDGPSSLQIEGVVVGTRTYRCSNSGIIPYEPFDSWTVQTLDGSFTGTGDELAVYRAVNGPLSGARPELSLCFENEFGAPLPTLPPAPPASPATTTSSDTPVAGIVVLVSLVVLVAIIFAIVLGTTSKQN